MSYMVRVSYRGRGVLSQQPFEYPLDLNHFKHVHFVAETGLGEIDQTLQQLAQHFTTYAASTDTTNNILGQIASSIRNGVFIKNDVTISLHNGDVLTILKEFILLWVV